MRLPAFHGSGGFKETKLNVTYPYGYLQAISYSDVHLQAIPDVLLSAFDGSGGFKDTKLNKYVNTSETTFIINTNMGSKVHPGP